MTVAETTLDAAEADFLSNVAGSITSPTATRITASRTIPNGAWAVALAIWDGGGGAGDNISISDSGSHTWTALHAYDATSRYALWGWYNNTGSSVSMTITFTWHFVNNGPAGTWVGAVTGAGSTTPSVRATLTNASTAQGTATPGQLNSLFCLHYAQWAPSADISSLVAGSATDASPLGHARFSGGPASIGTIYQSTPNAQTASPVTVGATAPTSAQTYGVLVEYFPASGSQTGAIAVSGAGAATVGSAITKLGAVAVVGAGAVAVAALVSKLGVVAVQGAGSVAVGQAQTEPGSIAVAGAGAVTLGAAVTKPGAVAVNGAGSVTLTGVRTQPGVVAVNGTGAVSVAGLSSVTGAIAVTGSGAVSLGGTHTVPGSVAPSGAGAVAIGAQGQQTGSMPVAGNGNPTVGGSVQHAGVVAPSGAALVTVASAGGAQNGSIPVAGQGAVVIGPSLTHPGSITVSASAAVAVGGAHTVAYSVVVNGTALVTVAGTTQGLPTGGIAVFGVALVTLAPQPAGGGILGPLRVQLGPERWLTELGPERWTIRAGVERWRVQIGVDRVKKTTVNEYIPLLIEVPKHAEVVSVQFVIGEDEAVPDPPTWVAAVSDPDGDWFAPVGPFADAGTWFVNTQITGSNGEQVVKYAGYVQVED